MENGQTASDGSLITLYWSGSVYPAILGNNDQTLPDLLQWLHYGCKKKRKKLMYNDLSSNLTAEVVKTIMFCLYFSISAS